MGTFDNCATLAALDDKWAEMVDTETLFQNGRYTEQEADRFAAILRIEYKIRFDEIARENLKPGEPSPYDEVLTIFEAYKVQVDDKSYVMVISSDGLNHLVKPESFSPELLDDTERLVGREGFINEGTFFLTDEEKHGPVHRIEPDKMDSPKDQWFYDVSSSRLIHPNTLLTFNMTEEAKKAGMSRDVFYEKVSDGRVLIATGSRDDVLPHHL